MTPRGRDAIAAALSQSTVRDRFALCLLVALARAVEAAPPGTIDDLLALLAEAPGAEERDDRAG